MRYRINDFSVNRQTSSLNIYVRVPDKIYEALEVQAGTSEIIGSQAQAIRNSIRLIANETTGGTILYATGSKMVGSTDPITSIKKMGSGKIKIVLDLVPLIDAATAEGDTEELAALNALAAGSEDAGDLWTIEMDFGEAPEDMKDPNSQLLASFFNITEATEYTALTPAEAIAIARDCQYNVMGTDWPIPTWLPTGVTEAQVESAAEGLGIPYHEPTQTA